MQTATRQEVQRTALTRAVSGQSWGNYSAIFQGFLTKGIPEEDIKPRENVFTYNAWLALGRQVKRGEHGVKVATVANGERTVADPDTGESKRVSFRRPWRATVFHISQTVPATK